MKPILLYTLERTGTNFASYCFYHISNDTITTHNKSKAFTTGKDINYKDYKVFVTVRNPKETLISSLLFMISEYRHQEDITADAKNLIDKQIVYFNDILDNENFYILSFEDFTTKTKDIFIKLAIDNNLLEIQKTKTKIKDNPFFDDPLSEILNSPTTDKKRYPRDKDYKGIEDVQKTLELKEIKEYLSISESLYNKIIDRYRKQ